MKLVKGSFFFRKALGYIGCSKLFKYFIRTTKRYKWGGIYSTLANIYNGVFFVTKIFNGFKPITIFVKKTPL